MSLAQSGNSAGTAILLQRLVMPTVKSKWALLQRLQKLVGFQFTPLAAGELQNNLNQRLERPKPIQRTDIASMGERIKHMNIIGNAEGFLLMTKGLQSRVRDTAEAINFLTMSISKFEEVLNSNTNSKVTLLHCARTLVALDEELRRQNNNEEFSFDSLRINRANEYFLRAVDIDPNDPLTLYHYAQFLEMCNKYDLAEEYYLQVLEQDPNYEEALHAYGILLEDRGEHEFAEKFFMRIAQDQNSSQPSSPAVSPFTSASSSMAAMSSSN
jgi:tetratricopeptide (TPR) repeat protein